MQSNLSLFQHSASSFSRRSAVPCGPPCIIDIELVYKGVSYLAGSEMLEGTITTRASEALTMFSDMWNSRTLVLASMN